MKAACEETDSRGLPGAGFHSLRPDPSGTRRGTPSSSRAGMRIWSVSDFFGSFGVSPVMPRLSPRLAAGPAGSTTTHRSASEMPYVRPDNRVAAPPASRERWGAPLFNTSTSVYVRRNLHVGRNYASERLFRRQVFLQRQLAVLVRVELSEVGVDRIRRCDRTVFSDNAEGRLGPDRASAGPAGR